MKKNYTLPKVEIVKLNAADIITASLIAENELGLTPEIIGEYLTVQTIPSRKFARGFVFFYLPNVDLSGCFQFNGR